MIAPLVQHRRQFTTRDEQTTAMVVLTQTLQQVCIIFITRSPCANLLLRFADESMLSGERILGAKNAFSIIEHEQTTLAAQALQEQTQLLLLTSRRRTAGWLHQHPKPVRQ